MELPKTTIEWSNANFEEWTLYLAKTSNGLCYISTPGENFKDFTGKITKRYKNIAIVQNSEALKPYVNELQEYFNGSRQPPTLPIDLKGTPFQEETWQALRKIPYGTTVSYSDIAKQINRPTAVRAVGAAIGANPVLISIPCHRVIGKNGSMTGFRAGLDFKQFLLELEKK